VTVLVAGVGNLFQGDDGFGCEVLRRLAGHALPPGVVARDFGTSALDLRFWMERHDAVVVVDVVARGRAPGTLVVLDPEGVVLDPEVPPPAVVGSPVGAEATHGLTATDVVSWAAARRARGEMPHQLRVVGCEPATFGDPEEGALGLSDAVEAAVPRAIELVLDVVGQLTHDLSEAGGSPCTSSV
jgi:hydrogenase maturation protease